MGEKPVDDEKKPPRKEAASRSRSFAGTYRS